MTENHGTSVHLSKRRAFFWPLTVAAMVSCSGGEKTTGTPGGGTDNTVASVQITNVPTTVFLVGDSARLVAAAVNSSGGTVANQVITWSSSVPGVATVNAAGLLLGVDAGTTVISASVGGKTAQATLTTVYGARIGETGGVLLAASGRLRLTVPTLSPGVVLIARPATTLPTDARALAATAFEVTPPDLALPGLSQLTLQYDAATLPSNLAKESLQLYVLEGTTWSPVYRSTVDVANRTVTGLVQRTGTYVVRSTAVERISLSGVVVGGSVYVGDTATIKVTLFGANGLDTLPTRPISWSSSAADVISVDSTGKLTARAPGSATITATTDGKSASATTVVATRQSGEWSRAAEWTTWGGNAQHTAYVDATVDAAAFRLRWSAVPMAGASLYQVTTGGGAIFANSFLRFAGQSLVSMDPSAGAIRWLKAFDINTRVTQSTWDNGSLYVQAIQSSNGLLYHLNAADGAVQYSAPYVTATSPWYDAPIVVGSSLVLGSPRSVFGVLKSTGAQQFARAVTNFSFAAPTAENGTAYIVDGGVFGVSPATGTVTMQVDDARLTDAVTPVVAAPGVLVVATPQVLLAVNTVSKTIAWAVDGAFGDALAAANGKLYTLADGALTVRSATDGSVLWSWAAPQSCGASLVVTNNVVFVGCTDTTYALDLGTHLPIWSYPAAGYLSLSGPQGALYIASGQTVTAINLR